MQISEHSRPQSDRQRDQLDRYSDFVDKMFAARNVGIEGALHASIGISGEAGEVLEKVKKTWVHQRPLNIDELTLELGDVLFYVQAMANLIGVSLAQVIDMNRAKLTKRYPNGYSHQASAARIDAPAPLPERRALGTVISISRAIDNEQVVVLIKRTLDDSIWHVRVDDKDASLLRRGDAIDWDLDRDTHFSPLKQPTDHEFWLEGQQPTDEVKP